MTAERYLQSIRDMRFMLERLEIRRDSIHTPINSGAITYDNIHVQTSPDGGKLENDVIRTVHQIERLDAEIKRRRERFEARKQEATDRIMSMNEGQCRRFLLDYYIDGKSIKDLEEAYRYIGLNSIYNLKKRAIKKYSRVHKSLNRAE